MGSVKDKLRAKLLREPTREEIAAFKERRRRRKARRTHDAAATLGMMSTALVATDAPAASAASQPPGASSKRRKRGRSGPDRSAHEPSAKQIQFATASLQSLAERLQGGSEQIHLGLEASIAKAAAGKLDLGTVVMHTAGVNVRPPPS